MQVLPPTVRKIVWRMQADGAAFGPSASCATVGFPSTPLASSEVIGLWWSSMSLGVVLMFILSIVLFMR
jgi:hypothetical protein